MFVIPRHKGEIPLADQKSQANQDRLGDIYATRIEILSQLNSAASRAPEQYRQLVAAMQPFDDLFRRTLRSQYGAKYPRLNFETLDQMRLYELLESLPGIAPKKALLLAEAPGSWTRYLKRVFQGITTIETSIDSANGTYPSFVRNNGWKVSMTPTCDLRSKQEVQMMLADSVIGRPDKDLICCDLALPNGTFYSSDESALIDATMHAIVILVHTLKEGPNSAAILRYDTLSRKRNIDNISLLKDFFTEIRLVRPLCCHPLSTEIYVVCRGFKNVSLLPSIHAWINLSDKDTTGIAWSAHQLLIASFYNLQHAVVAMSWPKTSPLVHWGAVIPSYAERQKDWMMQMRV